MVPHYGSADASESFAAGAAFVAARQERAGETGDRGMNRVFQLWVLALLALAPRTTLAVNDMQPCALCVRSLTPNSIDLIAPPATFTIAGGGFVDKGFGLPLANFNRGGVLLGQ